MEHIEFIGKKKKKKKPRELVPDRRTVIEGYRRKGDSRIQCTVKWILGFENLASMF